MSALDDVRISLGEILACGGIDQEVQADPIVDQSLASFRDQFTALGVDLADEAQRRAVMVAVDMVLTGVIDALAEDEAEELPSLRQVIVGFPLTLLAYDRQVSR